MKNWRINLVFSLIILFGAVIIGRLVYLQILNHDFWKALAQGQQTILQPIQAERGEIFLNGPEGKKIVLATNQKGKFVYLSPREIRAKEETAKILSEILELDYDELLKKIQKDNLFEPVKYKLSQEEELSLRKINLPGIYLGEMTFRSYPQDHLASQVIGFLAGDGRGQYGLEGFYDEILRGGKGFKEGSRNPWGYLISLTKEEQIPRGFDIVLNLDYNIQFQAEKLLEKAKETLDIESGQIIVMDPHSGKIIAMANFPHYNPNEYSKIKEVSIFQNSAIQKIFEPGSVFKPIVMAAALNEEKITPQTKYLDQGSVKIGGYTIYNYDNKTWGERTMTEVLEKSINTGAIFAQRQLSHQKFLEYLEKFGIFEKTGIDLQGEVFSTNSEFKKGYEINFATASFGQGIEMTPIQILRAFAVIANGGKLVKPYLVEEIIDQNVRQNDDGMVRARRIKVQPEIQNPSVISKKTASQLTTMLISVVEQGTAKRTKIPGYYIAGKTGTAQVPWSSLGKNMAGYSDKTWQTFIGFAPAFNPRFLILVKLDNPKARTAEVSAVPIFHDLAKYIIDLWEIPPDYQ